MWWYSNGMSSLLVFFCSALIGNEDVSATNYHLGSAMGHLPRRQREAIHLKFYLNMSNEEISTSMEIGRAHV